MTEAIVGAVRAAISGEGVPQCLDPKPIKGQLGTATDRDIAVYLKISQRGVLAV